MRSTEADNLRGCWTLLRRRGVQLQLEFRAGRLGTAARGQLGKMSLVSELDEQWILAREKVGEGAALLRRYFDDGLTGIEQLLRGEWTRVEQEVRGLHEVLGEIDGIVRERDLRQHVAVPHELLDELDLVALRNAVATVPHLLDVGRG